MCYILFGKTFQALTITEKQEPKVNLLSTLIETKSKCTMGLLKFRVSSKPEVICAQKAKKLC